VPTSALVGVIPQGPEVTPTDRHELLNDTLYQLLPWELEIRHALSERRLPFWSDRLEGGSSPWGNPQAAVLAYQAVVEKFPDHPVAADAQYQIGYLWFNSARGGIRDAKATENAKIGFQDFIYRYPKSEKVPQARENLRMLEHKATTNAYEIAKYYDKQKNYRAAVIYYNDVIRQQPGTPEGDRAKRRVDELRAKVGDDKLQSAALTAATAKPPKSSTNKSGGQRESGSNSEDGPAMRASQEDVAPLPPPDLDESLPPPASLSPGTTLAPDLPSSSASPTPEPSATPAG
jgi:outer membrane protein assembly factor BamD